MADYPDFLYRVKQAVPFTGYPLHRNEDFRPFFIIGSGRSGNTLVRRVLEAHPGIHIPPETYVLGPSIQTFARANAQHWKALVRLVLAEFEYYPEFVTFETTLRPLANRLYDLPKAERSLARILDAFYRYHAEVNQIPCVTWGDKTPLNTLWMGRIHSVFPRAKYINMIRDGVDVSASYVQAGIYRDLEAAAERWKRSLRLAAEFKRAHPGQVLDVRYEELVSSPESAFKSICQFLGLDFQPDMLGLENSRPEKMGDVAVYKHHDHVREPISAKSIGKGRQQLSAGEKTRLEALIGKELAQYGYTPCASDSTRVSSTSHE